MGITLRNGIQVNKVKTPPIYDGPTVFSDDQLIKVGGKYVTTDLQVLVYTDKKITEDNITQMRILDIVKAGVYDNVDTSTYEEYLNVEKNIFQKYAKLTMGIN